MKKIIEYFNYYVYSLLVLFVLNECVFSNTHVAWIMGGSLVVFAGWYGIRQVKNSYLKMLALIGSIGAFVGLGFATEGIYSTVSLTICILAIPMLLLATSFAPIIRQVGLGAIAVWFVLITINVVDYSIYPYQVAMLLVLALREVVEYFNGSKIALNFWPVYVVLLALFCVLPVQESPYGWPKLSWILHQGGKVVDQIATDLEYYFDDDSKVFHLSMAGYSEDASFSDAVSSSNVEELVISGQRTKGNLYLAGHIYNQYTNKGWEENYSDDMANETGVAYAEYLTSIYGLEKSKIFTGELKDAHVLMYDIIYGNLRTQSGFSAPLTVQWQLPKSAKNKTKHGNLVFDKSVSNGFNYRLTTLDRDTSTSLLLALEAGVPYAKEQPPTYEQLEKMSKQRYNSPLSNLLSKEDYEKELAEREQQVEENFLELPDHLPQRVRDLANDLTKDQDTTVKKVKAIEQFLKTYHYTTKPQYKKDSTCPVDTFLFETKEGYCVHYATAMTVLCRCVGIPARYVEGYCVDFGSKNKDNQYIVMGNRAHSWCQAYIEGLGFITFEPTGGYATHASPSWAVAESLNNGDLQISKGVDYDKYSLQQQDQHVTTAANATTEKQKTTGEKKTKKSTWSFDSICTILLWIVVVIVGLLIIMILFVVLLTCYRRREYRVAKKEKQYKILLAKVFVLWQWAGYEKQESQTFREFVDEINPRFLIDQNIVQELVKNHEKIMYGNAVIEKAEIDLLKKYMDLLKPLILVEIPKNKLRSIGLQIYFDSILKRW